MAMKNRILLFLLTLMTATLYMSCSKENVDSPDNESLPEGFIDYGFIPAEMNWPPISNFRSAAYHNGHVFVATDDGLWKNNLSTKEWNRSGLAGKAISLIYKHPLKLNTLFAGTLSDEFPSDPYFRGWGRNVGSGQYGHF